MNLPTRISLIDGGAFLDGGTATLDALTETGESFSIQLNQHLLPGTSNPGRLLCNSTLVDVRSEYESSLLRLLETADIQIKEKPRAGTDRNRIGPPNQWIEAARESKISCIDDIRNWMIDFVRSERYIEVYRHGVQFDA